MREYTNKLLELIDEGFYGEVSPTARDLIVRLLVWISEDDVKQFWLEYGFTPYESEND